MPEKVNSYATEELAFAAVEHFKQPPWGVWTGIQKQPDGTYKLLYQPDSYTPRHDRPARGLTAYDLD